MLWLIAQTEEASPNHLTNLFDTVVSVFSRGDMLAQPDKLVDSLQQLSIVWAVVFIVAGLLCMFNGYKFYKITTVSLAALIGMFGGYWLGQHIAAPFIVAGCLGLLLAVVALPLMKYAIAVFGGLIGAFAGANLWSGFAHAINTAAEEQTIPADAYWIGALVGLIVFGMLAFILFKLSIELFTSVSGSTIAVLGVIALLLSIEPWRPTVSSGLQEHQLVVPLLVFVPAIIALILQEQTKDPVAAKE